MGNVAKASIKKYNDESDKGYFFEFDVQNIELHNDLPFLPERMKIEKFEKVIADLHDKSEFVH